mmetsp:Transcript_34577/g.115507  ORF Transcript_34577/g.115507 Transcript_34577/m.115507 type:complete len:280 (+) Transcript_34577:293-1132(+)
MQASMFAVDKTHDWSDAPEKSERVSSALLKLTVGSAVREKSASHSLAWSNLAAYILAPTKLANGSVENEKSALSMMAPSKRACPKLAPVRSASRICAPANDTVVREVEPLSEAAKRFVPLSTAPPKMTPLIMAPSRLAQRRSALRRSGHVSKMAFGRASAAHPPRDLPGSGGRLPPQGLGGGGSVAGAARGIGGGGSAVASGLGGGGSVVEAASGLGGGGGEGGLGGGESGLGNGRPADGGKVAPGAGTLARGEANADVVRLTMHTKPCAGRIPVTGAV